MNDAANATVATLAPSPAPAKARGRLFRKYVAFFVAAIALALLINGASEVWFPRNANLSCVAGNKSSVAQSILSRSR